MIVFQTLDMSSILIIHNKNIFAYKVSFTYDQIMVEEGIFDTFFNLDKQCLSRLNMLTMLAYSTWLWLIKINLERIWTFIC